MKLSNVSCKYGAPMGRSAQHADDTQASRELRLVRVLLDNGGYDNGGAYWGMPSDLYRVFSVEDDGDNVDFYLRAGDQTQAESLVRQTYPRATFAPVLAEDALEEFLAGYIEAALFSTNDESNPETGGEPLDANYTADDIEAESLAKMRRDCEAFLNANGDKLDNRFEEAGRDFWFTRNGHGVGFWDGDWPEHGAALTTASKVGTVNLWVVDGKITQD